MMTTKRFTMFAIVMVMCVLFVGCKKEKTENVAYAPQTSVSGMLHFNSAEEFLETQQKVLAMSETERRKWEQQQGFKSYATKCYELLEKLEAKGISSDQDIYDFVNENSEYFYIYEENGEKYLQNRLENTLYRYLVNENQMMTQNNVAMKVFEEGIVTGPIKGINEMYSIEKFENVGFKNGLLYNPTETEIVDFTHYTSETESDTREIKDSIWRDAKTATKWSYIGQRIKTGLFANANRNVTKVYFERYQYSTQMIGDVPTPIYHWRSVGTVKPYHRIAGIWYVCQRTKTYNIHTEWSYDNMPSSDSGSDTSIELEGIGGYERIFFNNDYSTKPVEFKFDEFSGWSFTPDTPQINFPLASETN